MIRAVLFDRDGTLIVDGDRTPTLMPGAVAAIARLRERDLRIGVVTNQPHAGTDQAYLHAMQALHERIEAETGALDGWFVCTHAPAAGCVCRKPEPGLISDALRAFGVGAGECVVIGDIGSDIEAARRAGTYAILVPTPVTRPQEVADAPVVCRNLLEAVDYVLWQAAA